MRAIGSASALAQPTSDTLVFVPTYNEARTIGPLIDEILRLPVAADVLVVDDRSSDNTRTEVQARAAASQRVKLVGRPCKLGIGSAHRLGWLYARRSGYARIVTLDGDFSHDPADIPRLLRAIDNGADFVIGSRFAPGGRLDYRGIRRIVSRSANILARSHTVRTDRNDQSRGVFVLSDQRATSCVRWL